MNLTFFLFSYLVIQSVPVNFSLSKNNNQLVFFQSMCLVIKSHQLTGLCWCLCLCVCVCVCGSMAEIENYYNNEKYTNYNFPQRRGQMATFSAIAILITKL